jgi:3-phosphoshikimate 1-carboxyvinyltransferase
MIINPVQQLVGEISVPGDKSISHRAIMFSALAEGTSTIHNFLLGEDCLSTIRCFKQLGIEIERDDQTVTVHGKGLNGLQPSKEILDVGNSGTTIRLMSGILSAQSFETQVTGDASIQKRPMKRVMDPLSKMGADIESINNTGCAPIHIKGKELKGINYTLPIASAQVKSAIILASLYANGPTEIIEPASSRDHTEIMLNYFGANIQKDGLKLTVEPSPTLKAQKIVVPGDISSAAFFITAALIVPNSRIIIKNVGINPTRDGILEVYKNMEAKIEIVNQRTINGELVADIIAETSDLIGTTVEGDIIPRLIDEIPIIAVAAAFAKGTTVIKDAEELKVKESNRIDAMVDTLTKMGASIKGTADGMIIEGGQHLSGQVLESYHDHRIAMSSAVAGLVAKGSTEIKNSECISISYPSFFADLEKLTK